MERVRPTDGFGPSSTARAPRPRPAPPMALSEETSVLALWLLGCWVARLGFTANALEYSDLCPQN